MQRTLNCRASTEVEQSPADKPPVGDACPPVRASKALPEITDAEPYMMLLFRSSLMVLAVRVEGLGISCVWVGQRS